MLDNSHKAVGSDGCTNLYSDSVLGSSPELLDLEVLLEPLEEQLYLPSVLVKAGYLLGCQVHRIGQEQELSTLLLIVESYETQMFEIVLATLIDGQLNLCICEYVLRQTPFPFDALVLQIGLGSDDKEGLHSQYAVKLLKVIVASIEDVVSTCLIGNFLHGFGVMDRSSGDVVERRNLCLKVVEDVSLDAAFLLTELCPPEHRKTERYRSGVKRIDLAAELEYVRCPFLSRLLHHVESKRFKNAIVAILICSSQCRFSNRIPA